MDILLKALNGSLDEIKDCLKDYIRVVVNKAGEHGRTVLHNAAKENSADVVEYLISLGAKIDARTSDDCSLPLHTAASFQKSAKVLQLLINAGRTKANIDVDEKTSYLGNTSLQLAALHNPNADILKCLISNNADKNVTSGDGMTLLHMAAMENTSIEVLKYLITQSAGVNVEDAGGMTPLHYAAAGNSNAEISKCLIDNGANVKLEERNGATPLHMAAAHNPNAKVLEILISAGAKVDAKPARGGPTPLDLASTEEKKYILRNAMNYNKSSDTADRGWEVGSIGNKSTMNSLQEYINSGMAYIKEDNYDDAITDFEAALQIDPNNANTKKMLSLALTARGSRYAKDGDDTQAIEDFEAILCINPNDAQTKKYLQLLRGY
ncbi:MAG: ankyrin repeat domain-containing protein [Fibromonadales bacterium]|nr:ankyrin repeat domain-containing protein [Fibromonadales bacterium]